MPNSLIKKEAKGHNPRIYNRAFTGSARESLRTILNFQNEKAPGKGVLLPSYVGFSKIEGSGVFDPVVESRSRHDFYHQDRFLVARMESIEKLLQSGGFHSLVVIHYFGYYSLLTEQISTLCRSHGVRLIEDWAHCIYPAIWSDYCPMIGDFHIFSIHKTIKSRAGGILLSKTLPDFMALQRHTIAEADLSDFLATDFSEIMHVRRENSDFIRQGLKKSALVCALDFPNHRNLGPLNLPLLISSPELRHSLYTRLVERGLEPTALYHTLISAVDKDKYPDAYFIAGRILNLPVHQDCSRDSLGKLISCVNDWIDENELSVNK